MKTHWSRRRNNSSALLLALNRRGGSRSPFSPARFPLTRVHKDHCACRPSAFRSVHRNAARCRVSGMLRPGCYFVPWRRHGAPGSIADRVYALEHTGFFSSLRAQGCACRAKIPEWRHSVTRCVTERIAIGIRAGVRCAMTATGLVALQFAYFGDVSAPKWSPFDAEKRDFSGPFGDRPERKSSRKQRQYR